MPASLLRALFFLPLLLAALVASSPETCAPRDDDCSLYPNCLESLYHCGSNGYPIGYGYKYCNKFQVSRPNFSKDGQEWVSKLTYCLENALEPYLTLPPEKRPTCDQLKEAAFGTHPKCYVDSGFCTLPVTDWLEIAQIIGPETLLMKDTLIQAMKTVELCVEKGAVAFFESHL